jgi:hypothetical protein
VADSLTWCRCAQKQGIAARPLGLHDDDACGAALRAGCSRCMSAGRPSTRCRCGAEHSLAASAFPVAHAPGSAMSSRCHSASCDSFGKQGGLASWQGQVPWPAYGSGSPLYAVPTAGRQPRAREVPSSCIGNTLAPGAGRCSALRSSWSARRCTTSSSAPACRPRSRRRGRARTWR